MRWHWPVGVPGRILLLGGCVVALQQVRISYRLDFFGVETNASLVHLHAGLLLVIAMLVRDRRVVAGCFAVAFAGWLLRQTMLHGMFDRPWLVLGAGIVIFLFQYAWTVLCARLAGWPRPDDVPLRHFDLLSFALYGLVLYPIGLALVVGYGVNWMVSGGGPQSVGVAYQMFFAKQFGVAVLSLPLLIALRERKAPPAPARGPLHWLWPPALVLAVVASFWSASRVREAMSADTQVPVLVMDFRFALLVLLGWCVARLPTRWSMSMLSLALFGLITIAASAAEAGGTTWGLVNLFHIAAESSVLLLVLCYLWVTLRDRAELLDRIEADSRRDGATGLPNLKALRERILRPVPRAELGCLMLDRAWALAVGYGIDMQARALATVADRLQPLVEVYTLGVGQFALLPRDPDRDDVWEQVVSCVEQTEIEAEGNPLRLLPYLGVVPFDPDVLPTDPRVFDLVVSRASHLAFDARQHGELRPRRSSDDDGRRQQQHRQLLDDAAVALSSLRNGRVALYFQEIRALEPGQGDEPDMLCGEVLCRLYDEQGSLVYPQRFLAALEHARRGAELDLGVLRALFEELRRRPAAIPRCSRLGVNLTGQGLASAGFRKELLDLLDQSPLPLDALCFEVTERIAISNPTTARQLLAELRDRGCRIAIDDFGTGLQSFARLRELPIDVLKIDGSFVRNIVRVRKDHAVVQASVAVARAFGATTVAEYVENAEIEACVRQIGVDYGQGFHYGAPKPLHEVLAQAAG